MGDVADQIEDEYERWLLSKEDFMGSAFDSRGRPRLGQAGRDYIRQQKMAENHFAAERERLFKQKLAEDAERRAAQEAKERETDSDWGAF